MTFGTGATRVDALRDISMDVMAGEVVGLRGPSGSVHELPRHDWPVFLRSQVDTGIRLLL